MLSLFNAGLVGNAELVAVVLPLALLYGGLAQLLAGMWEFRNDNTFGAVAFTSYGAFWISYFFYARFVAGSLPPADAHTATGIFLLMWTIFTAYMTLAALKTNGVLVAVFGTVLVTFALLTVGEFAESTFLLHAGGYVGSRGRRVCLVRLCCRRREPDLAQDSSPRLPGQAQLMFWAEQSYAGGMPDAESPQLMLGRIIRTQRELAELPMRQLAPRWASRTPIFRRSSAVSAHHPRRC